MRLARAAEPGAQEKLKQNPGLSSAGHRELRLALLAILLSAALLRLIFAQAELDADRFWDEQWSVQNVAATLGAGSYKPAHSLYPTLSFLPHTAVLGLSELLHRVTGREALAVFANPGRTELSSTGYLLARFVAVAFGVWSLWLLFRLGSRLLDPASALLGTLVLATFWRHLRASGQFQPNIVALALLLLATWWCLDALRSERWAAFALAGVGIGLATSAKQIAALVALVLVAGVLMKGRDASRLLPRLALAGVVSLATFLALNPWPARVLTDFDFQVRYYERAGAREGGSPAKVLISTLEFFGRHLGAVIAIFAVLGLLLLLWRGLRARPRQVELLALLSFGLGYPILYAAITPNYESQNMLLVAPCVSLAAGFGLLASWRFLARRWSVLTAPPARWLAFGALVVWTHLFPVQATYREVVPTTQERAAARLEAIWPPPERRVVYFEKTHKEGEEIRVHRAGFRLPTLPFRQVNDPPAELLDLADAEIFPAARLRHAAYLRRRQRPEVTGVERIGWNPLSARGEELLLLLHPWDEVGPAQDLPVEDLGAGKRRAALGGLVAAGEVISISVTAPRNGRRPPLESLSLDGAPLTFHELTTKGSALVRFHSERRRLSTGPRELILDQRRKGEGSPLPEVNLHRWRRGGPT